MNRIARLFGAMCCCIAPLSGLDAESACRFDRVEMQFKGSHSEQASCLLRPLFIKGAVGPEQPLPITIESLVGTSVCINAADLRAYLNAKKIDEADLGGSLNAPLSRAKAGASGAREASYFVIHDTSTPNLLTDPFPVNMNDASWKHNQLDRWRKGDKSKAHVFVNRRGESITAVDFATPWRATQFELQYGSNDPKGLFIHVENVQPRRSLRDGRPGNDHIAPEPGLNGLQYDRLALLYVAASVRKREWMVPALHGVLDLDVGDHDDPQNFDIEVWASSLQDLLAEISCDRDALIRTDGTPPADG